MEDFSQRLYAALKDSCNLCTSSLLSLSGGLDSSVISFLLKHRKLQAVAVIAEDFISTDLTYCQMISKEMRIPLTIHNVKTTDILQGVEETVKILKNFNDIEIRNNVVMYLAIKWARDRGTNSIITGDGADEMFAGYSFLINKPPNELESEIKRICSVMHFPTQKIGKALGVRVESPFLNENVMRLALEIPADLKVREEDGTRHGKWILRKAFQARIPPQVLWRKKSPMQEGSGTAGLTKMFDSIVGEEQFVEKKLTVKKTDNIVIRNRESMHYYEIYKRFFGLPPAAHSEHACPYCRHDIGESKFCRMCGAFPV